MTYPTRLKPNGITVVALAIALLFAVVFPTPVAALLGGPINPVDQEDPTGSQGPGTVMDNTGDTDTGDTGTETPGVPEVPVIPDMPDEDDDSITEMQPGPHASALSDRIVLHVATPVQLVKSGDGLQFYYIGADGSTVSGPVFPSFSELAEMHPSGAWVPLLDAVNSLTGKPVNVDYIPNEQKIRVFTYYPDKGQDVNKQYIFNFGSDYSINVEAW